MLARYEEERREREKVMLGLRESQNRIGQAATYGRSDDSDELLGGHRMKTAEQLSAREDQRKRCQFEAEASDDERENEIDKHLEEISQAARRLKALGTAMGGELDHQNRWIDGIAKKTGDLDDKIQTNTERVRSYSRSKSIFV